MANLLLITSDGAMRERVRRLLVADGHEVSVAGCFTPELNGAADALIVEDSMRDLRRKSAELSTLKERLAMLLVHDLKTPLSVVKTNLELLNEAADLGPEERAEMVADALVATDRLLGMIMDLLDISRTEEGRLSLDPVQTPLEVIVSEVVRRHRHLAGVRRIAIEVDLAAELEARIDVKLFQRVIENILGNSLRYAPDGGLVRIGAAAAADQVELYIENDGPSIPVSVRQRLFEKYGQVDLQESRQRFENRGLGLYFCRLVVEAHGGTIVVADRDGEGARFEIRLPQPGRRLAEAPASAPAEPAEPAEAPLSRA